VKVEAADTLTDRSAQGKILEEETVVFFCLGCASNCLGARIYANTDQYCREGGVSRDTKCYQDRQVASG